MIGWLIFLKRLCEAWAFIYVRRFHLHNIPKNDIRLTLSVNRITCAIITTTK